MPIAGVVALSPRIYEQRWPKTSSEAMLKTPVFCTHGHLDPVIPFAQTKAGIENLANLGVQTNFKGHEMEHEIIPDEILDLRNWLNDRL